MLKDLYDNVSLMFSWRWPEAQGIITRVDARPDMYSRRGGLRLVVRYQFSIGQELAYAGESRSPVNIEVTNIHESLPIGGSVKVRYRPDDPNVNTLDRSVWDSFAA